MKSVCWSAAGTLVRGFVVSRGEGGISRYLSELLWMETNIGREGAGPLGMLDENWARCKIECWCFFDDQRCQ